jgi:hypothetical protein
MSEPSDVERRRARLVVFIVLAVIVLTVLVTLVVGVLTTPGTRPERPADGPVLAEGVPCRLQSVCSSS